MKIIKAEILVLDIPMVKSLAVSFGTIKNLKPLIIKLTDELGNIGYGESILLPFPMTHFEYLETGLEALKKFIIPSILNKEITLRENNCFETIEDFIGNYSHIKNYEMTKVGVENALIHILTKRLNKNIYMIFGAEKSIIKTEYCFGIPSDLGMYIEDIAKEVSNGYDIIKLKICKGKDIELINLVRANFPNIKICLDANQDFDLESLKKILPVIDSNHIEMIEQPFRYDDYIANIEIKKLMKTKLCLDESICRIDQLENMIRYKGIDVLNIKIGRVGGVYSAYKINKICEENSIGTWVGGLLETSIGKGFNLAIAGMGNCKYSNDFSVWNEFYSDYITKTPNVIINGEIKINLNSDGVGFEVDEEKLKKYTINNFIYE